MNRKCEGGDTISRGRYRVTEERRPLEPGEDANVFRATRGGPFGMGREIQTKDSHRPGGKKGSLGAHGVVESQTAATQGEEKPAV